MTPLCELAVKYGTDKCSSAHMFTPIYHEMFKDRRESVRKVLEIGVGSQSSMGNGYKPGASLRMWRDYFPNADVYGLDVNENVLFDEGRIRCFHCDQGSRDSLLSAARRMQSLFDLIVDDGSHVPAHQILSAHILTRSLAEGGVYVIEDLIEFNPANLLAQMLKMDFRVQEVECPSERDPHERVVMMSRA